MKLPDLENIGDVIIELGDKYYKFVWYIILGGIGLIGYIIYNGGI